MCSRARTVTSTSQPRSGPAGMPRMEPYCVLNPRINKRISIPLDYREKPVFISVTEVTEFEQAERCRPGNSGSSHHENSCARADAWLGHQPALEAGVG